MPYRDCTAKIGGRQKGPDKLGCFNQSIEPGWLVAMVDEESARKLVQTACGK
jgi:hypothetical protein